MKSKSNHGFTLIELSGRNRHHCDLDRSPVACGQQARETAHAGRSVKII